MVYWTFSNAGLQVESYLKILGEPKLPSLFLQVQLFPCLDSSWSSFFIAIIMLMVLSICDLLQVICWVLGEYGTADGKHSASYIMGKLCDVAEAHSNDDNVKVELICITVFIHVIPNGWYPGHEIYCVISLDHQTTQFIFHLCIFESTLLLIFIGKEDEKEGHVANTKIKVIYCKIKWNNNKVSGVFFFFKKKSTMF